MVDRPVDLFAVPETDLHLRRMDVDVNIRRIDRKLQHRKWILVLHHERFICVLDRLSDDTALDIASVDEIIFIRAVAARDQRLTDEASYPARISSGIHLNQVCRDLASKDRINYIF